MIIFFFNLLKFLRNSRIHYSRIVTENIKTNNNYYKTFLYTMVKIHSVKNIFCFSKEIRRNIVIINNLFNIVFLPQFTSYTCAAIFVEKLESDIYKFRIL